MSSRSQKANDVQRHDLASLDRRRRDAADGRHANPECKVSEYSVSFLGLTLLRYAESCIGFWLDRDRNATETLK